jgi:amphi-Trp domain-containing protein
MGKRTGEFVHESVEDPNSIVAYLDALAGGFRGGQLAFSSGKKQLNLTPDGLLKLVVKASVKEDTSKITLRISWKSGERRDSEPPSLVIESPGEKDG